MDAIDVIAKQGGEVPISPNVNLTVKNGQVLVRMKSEYGSWTTPSGAKFSSDHPFQVIDFFEAERLINNNPERFAEGNEEDVKAFYGV